MNGRPLTWAAISGVLGVVVGLLGVMKFVLEPQEVMLERARQNFIRALAERDASYVRELQERDQRLDYLQRQIDDLRRPGERL